MGLIDERLNKAGDIPEFITEIAAGNDGIFGEGLIHAGGAATEDAETEGVGTIFSDHVHRIDDITLTFRHFLAVGVEDETVEIDFAEGNFAGDVEAHHDHAGDPSKENVGAGFHDVKGIIGIFLVLGPIGADDGPVGTGEPGIEGVFVTVISDAADFDFGEIYTGIKDPFGSLISLSLVEHRDGDTPRDLAGNIPIFETFEIVNKNLFLIRRMEGDFTVFKMLNGSFGKTLDVDEPLGFKHRFDNGAAFITVGDGVGDFLGATHEAGFFEILENFFAGFEGGETTVSFGNVGIHSAVFGDDGDALKIMAFADFKVVEIVSRGDLDGAGTVLGVGVFVGDDGNFAVGEREFDKTTDEILIARIVRIDSDGGIAKEGLGTGGADDDFGVLDIRVIIGATIRGGDDLIGDVPEVAGLVLMFDFDVGEGGLVVRTEINQLLATVNHAVVPHFLESFVDARDNVFIKSESEIIPSTRGTKSTKLELHIAALLLDEVPNAGIELVTRVFKAGVAFFFEGAFIDDPSFEAGVIGTRDIPSIFATETVVTSKRIFEGDGEAVTDVEIAVGVGGWHDDGITIISIGLVGINDLWWVKSAGMFPFGVDLGLESARFVAFGEFHRFIIS